MRFSEAVSDYAVGRSEKGQAAVSTAVRTDDDTALRQLQSEGEVAANRLLEGAPQLGNASALTLAGRSEEHSGQKSAGEHATPEQRLREIRHPFCCITKRSKTL